MRLVRNFKELRSVTSLTTDTLNFGSRNFRIIRVVLRLLSLWRPQSAGFIESYVYPVSINLLLLTMGIIRNSIQATMKSTVLNIQVLYIVHEVVIWLGHIFANCYFSSRDLESNVQKPARPLAGIEKPLYRRLKVLNAIVIVSFMFFSIMLCVLFVMTEFTWNDGAQRFSAKLPNVDGPLDHVLYALVILIIMYDLGIGLALSWTLALLYSFYAARLKVLENIFFKWKHSSVDAISFFIELYARPVKNSWKRISLWFLVHNIMALAIPLYGFELAQALSGRQYHSKHLPQFICYLLFVVTIWLTPLVISEQIKRRERKFLERINDISPWFLESQAGDPRKPDVDPLGGNGMHSLSESGVYTLPVAAANNLPQSPREMPSLGSTSTEDSDGHPSCHCRSPNCFNCNPTHSGSSPNFSHGSPMYSNGNSNFSDGNSKYAEYTFVGRGKELRNFLRFLKSRTPGLVSRGYSLQLNLSLISLAMGAISFLTELHSRKYENIMYSQCNCTMS